MAEGDASLNVLTVDVEEYYHGHEFTDALGREGVLALPSRVVLETERLLDLLDRHGARATFFTLGAVAQRFPRLVREIAARGHELASHGWDHTPVYALGRERFRADVRRSRQVLEQIGGRSVGGYRAPNYSIRRDTPRPCSSRVASALRISRSSVPCRRLVGRCGIDGPSAIDCLYERHYGRVPIECQ